MPPIQALPHTTVNSALHMKRAHHQVMVWNAVERAPSTSAADISKFGWEVRCGEVSPAIHTGSPASAQVMRELCNVGAGQSRHTCMSEKRVTVKQSTYLAPHTASVQSSMMKRMKRPVK